MKSNDYVIINNRAYDPVTGLLVEENISRDDQAQPIIQPKTETKADAPQRSRGVATPNVHRTIQRSSTLSRRYVQKPATASKNASPIASQPAQAPANNPQPIVVPKSESIQKFPSQRIIHPRAATIDRPAETHPMVRRATNRSFDISPSRQRMINQQRRDTRAMPTAPPQNIQKAQPVVARPLQTVQKVQKPAHIIKNEAIERALKNEMVAEKPNRAKKQQQSKSWSRFVSLATASLAIVVLAGYLTYLSMPNLSVRMAAIQSGVDAKYPSYRPDGYSLSGPITYEDGEVSMKFAYAGDDQGFTLKQQRSSWDSSAVRQFVDTKTESPTTTAIDGLTIYSYNNNAAWVNGGVLYTIESDAPLSSEQIQKLATSL